MWILAVWYHTSPKDDSSQFVWSHVACLPFINTSLRSPGVARINVKQRRLRQNLDTVKPRRGTIDGPFQTRFRFTSLRRIAVVVCINFSNWFQTKWCHIVVDEKRGLLSFFSSFFHQIEYSFSMFLRLCAFCLPNCSAHGWLVLKCGCLQTRAQERFWMIPVLPSQCQNYRVVMRALGCLLFGSLLSSTGMFSLKSKTICFHCFRKKLCKWLFWDLAGRRVQKLDYLQSEKLKCVGYFQLMIVAMFDQTFKLKDLKLSSVITRPVSDFLELWPLRSQSIKQFASSHTCRRCFPQPRNIS